MSSKLLCGLYAHKFSKNTGYYAFYYMPFMLDANAICLQTCL